MAHNFFLIIAIPATVVCAGEYDDLAPTLPLQSHLQVPVCVADCQLLTDARKPARWLPRHDRCSTFSAPPHWHEPPTAPSPPQAKSHGSRASSSSNNHNTSSHRAHRTGFKPNSSPDSPVIDMPRSRRKHRAQKLTWRAESSSPARTWSTSRKSWSLAVVDWLSDKRENSITQVGRGNCADTRRFPS